jgi:hypothetical protein
MHTILSAKACLLVTLASVLLFSAVHGANRFAVASGNWNGSIWAATAGGSAGSAARPTSSDVVTINATRNVTVNIAAAAKSITINGSLIFSGNQDLTIANAGSLLLNNGAMIQFSSGGLILGGGNNASGILVDLNAGATLKTANTLGFVTGTGNTTLTGSISIRPGNRGAPQYDAALKYVYDGTAAQATGSAVSSANTFTVENTVGVTATNNLTVGTLVTDAGARLDMATRTLAVTNVSHAGTLLTRNTSATPFTVGKTWGGLVSYNATSAQTIVGGNYNNLDGAGGNRTLSPSGVIGIAGDFIVGSGNYTVVNSTVDFNGDDEQVIPAFTFNDLIVSNAGIKKIAASIHVVCQSVNINDDASVEVNVDGGGKLDVLD